MHGQLTLGIKQVIASRTARLCMYAIFIRCERRTSNNKDEKQSE